MQHSIFGTDGIRGRVGLEPITALSLVKIGYCFADGKSQKRVCHDPKSAHI